MLTITVLGNESFDNEKEEFVYPDSVEIELEHSLAVLHRWEAKYEKAFLGTKEKTEEELLDYIYFMIQSPSVDRSIIHSFTQENFNEIGEYMNAKMTATWFNDSPGPKRSGETITSELIYFWMSTFSIPLEFEHRHLNQLFTVIRIHSLKNQKPKKMSRAEARRQQRELNAQRQRDLGTRG